MFVLSVRESINEISETHLTKALRSVDPRARIEIVATERRIFVETSQDLEKIKRALAENGYHVWHAEPRP